MRWEEVRNDDEDRRGPARDASIRPFALEVPERLLGLRRRIAARRWPERQTVTDVTC
jgi:hypothetical protein